MQNLDQIGRELERRGKTAQLKQLADSAEGQKLGRMLDRQALEKAAKSGDTAALKQMLGTLLATDEGKRLADSVRQMMEH